MTKVDFSDVETANVALIATELSTNLIKHAGDGVIVIRLIEQGKEVGVELMPLTRSRHYRSRAINARWSLDRR